MTSRRHLIEADRLAVAKAGAAVGTRRTLNLIEGANVTLTVADDGPNDKVDVTVAAGAGAGVSGDGLVSNNGGALSGRTLTAGTGISVANGDGAGGDPTVTLALSKALVEATLSGVSFDVSAVKVSGVKVLGTQGAAIADAANATDAVTKFNTLLGVLRAHGLIAP